MYDDFKKLVSIGNRKIAKNTAIFNLSSATNCPCKEYCQFGIDGTCYALKAERMYKAVLPYRERQNNYWYSNNIDDIMDDFTEFLNRHKSIQYIRINEAGDIKCSNDLRRLELIAKKASLQGVTVYTYTHNIDALLAYHALYSDGLHYLKLNLSIDSKEPTLAQYNRFIGCKSIEGKEIVCDCSGTIKCMENCFNCTSNNASKIYVKIH